jgi:hypothetical protein
MELEDEVESLKAQIKREEKAREQQEWLVDVEINDLSKRYAYFLLHSRAGRFVAAS